MTIGLEEREKWLQQVGINAKDLLLEYYSRKFIDATDDLNEAVFRKDTESIAEAFADAKSCLALIQTKIIKKIKVMSRVVLLKGLLSRIINHHIINRNGN
jgi:hypothetical protein